MTLWANRSQLSYVAKTKEIKGIITVMSWYNNDNSVQTHLKKNGNLLVDIARYNIVSIRIDLVLIALT